MRLAPVFALSFALALFGTSVGESCTTYVGDFVATTESPCLESPVLLCTHGTLTGDLPSQYDFVMTSQTFLSDPADPTFLSFTGESVITTQTGKMQAQDTGKMWMRAGPWPFETTVNIHGGDGAWAGATGKLVATGALDHERGVTEGTYVGEICV